MGRRGRGVRRRSEWDAEVVGCRRSVVKGGWDDDVVGDDGSGHEREYG